MIQQQRSLSPRSRALVKVASLYALRDRAKARTIVRRELRRGTLSPRFFSELFIHLSLFLGYPAMLDGLESIADATPRRRRVSLRGRGANTHADGRRILERIYGRQASRLLRHLDGLYPGLGHRITQDAYGLIMTRSGLTLRDRELANVVVLYAHGFERQLYSHLRGALRVGISKKTLRLVVLLAADVVGKGSKQTLASLDKLSSK